MQKHIFKFLLCSLLGMIVSCKPNSPSIIGTWTGKPESNCPDNGFSGGVVSVKFTFTTDTILKMELTGSNNVDTSVVSVSDMQFRIEGDSLILTSNEVPDLRIAYSMKFDGNNDLTLTRSYSATMENKSVVCKTVNSLKRI